MSYKVLVTGGAGFIGSHIVDNLIKNDFQVTVIDNLSSGKKENVNSKANLEIGDIRDREFLEGVFKKETFDFVIHHAAQIDVRKSVNDPVYDAQINIIGLIYLLELSVKFDISKFVFASSGGVVYGEPEKMPVFETYPKGPLSPYGVSKLSSEYYLYYYHNIYKLPYTALRYGNVYGPRQDPHGEAGVVAIFIGKMLKSEIPVIFGNGDQLRDYVFVEDIANANVKALKSNVEGSSIDDFAFNIGTGIGTSVNELYGYLKKIANFPKEPRYAPPRKGELRKIALDSSKAKRMFDINTWTSFPEGLRITFDWFEKMKNEK